MIDLQETEAGIEMINQEGIFTGKVYRYLRHDFIGCVCTQPE